LGNITDSRTQFAGHARRMRDVYKTLIEKLNGRDHFKDINVN